MCESEDPVEDMLKDLNDHIATLRGRMEVAERQADWATGKEDGYQKEIARLNLELNQAREHTAALVEVVRGFVEEQLAKAAQRDQQRGVSLEAGLLKHFNQVSEGKVEHLEELKELVVEAFRQGDHLEELRNLVIGTYQRFGMADPDGAEAIPGSTSGQSALTLKPRKLRLRWPIIAKSTD